MSTIIRIVPANIVAEFAKKEGLSPTVAASILEDYYKRLESLQDRFIAQYPGINSFLARIESVSHSPLANSQRHKRDIKTEVLGDWGSLVEEEAELRARRYHHVGD